MSFVAAAKVEGVSEIQEFHLGLDVRFREVGMHTMSNTFLILFNKCFFWLQVMIMALHQKNPRIPEEEIVTAFNGY